MTRRGLTLRPRIATVGALSGVIGLLFQVAACVPLTAPSGTVITLLPHTNILPVDGSADITAVVIENGSTGVASGTGTGTGTTTGTPTSTAASVTVSGAAAGQVVHDGTTVYFTTTLGRIEPSEATTTNGQVTVKLIGDGRSGVATVTAYSGAAMKTISVTVGSTAAARISVAASPQSLAPTGGTTTITATVQDNQGIAVPGVAVTFATTAGTISASSVSTDANGKATTTLNTNVPATVTATVVSSGGNTLSATVSIAIQ